LPGFIFDSSAFGLTGSDRGAGAGSVFAGTLEVGINGLLLAGGWGFGAIGTLGPAAAAGRLTTGEDLALGLPAAGFGREGFLVTFLRELAISIDRYLPDFVRSAAVWSAPQGHGLYAVSSRNAAWTPPADDPRRWVGREGQ